MKKINKKIKLELFKRNLKRGVKVDTTSYEAHNLADSILKVWAKGYPNGNFKEILIATGNSKHSPLGKQFISKNQKKTIYDDLPINYDEEDYAKINKIVAQMSLLDSSLLTMHYILKARHNMTINQVLEHLSISRNEYYNRLKSARQNFIIRGGIWA